MVELYHSLREKMMRLNQKVIDTYQENGVICLKNIITDEQLAALSLGIKENRQNPSIYAESLKEKNEDAIFFNDYCNWQKIASFKWFIFHSKLADIVAQLMQSKTVTFYHEHVLVKEPGNQKATPWHHDQPYYPVNGKQLCSAWTPLDNVAKKTSLKFIKGSHLWDKLFIPRKFASNKNYTINETVTGDYHELPDIDKHLNDYEVLSFEVAPGDCIIFHGACLHSANGNNGIHTRRAFASRWLGDDARFATRPWDISPPITGGLKEGDKMICETFPQLR
jgi:ectoine hydroxylase-related dioxygenase (phytanoyl-CoA dioxygenase family)